MGYFDFLDEDTIDEFLRSGKWQELNAVIEEFVDKCPKFDGDKLLAMRMGFLLETLNCCFKEYTSRD